MEIFPVWRDLFFEYQGDVLEYRITIKDGDEIFHGRAVKSPKDRVIRIRLNDCCESYLNSLLGEEAFREAESIDRAFPLDAYEEFALDVIEGDIWETAYEWAFTNDYSYEYKEPQGSYSEPINGHCATGQLLPYSHLVTGDTESVCYDGCGGVFFTITSGVAVEYSWGGAVWRVRWDTNLDSVYYVCSDGTTGTISNKRLNKTLPRNYSFFKQQYTVRFYDRQGGTLLGTAVATVAAQNEPEPVSRSINITAPSTVSSATTSLTYDLTVNQSDYVTVNFYSGATEQGPWNELSSTTVSMATGTQSINYNIPENSGYTSVYWKADAAYNDYPTINASAVVRQLPENIVDAYLTLEAIDNVNLCVHYAGATGGTLFQAEYSTDGGSTWDYIPTFANNDTPQYVTIPAGSWVMIRGDRSEYPNWWNELNPSNPSQFVGGYTFNRTTGRFNISGNILSLVFGGSDTFVDSVPANAFRNLFNATSVVSAENLVLPSNSVRERGYYQMFYRCSSLVKAPKLPANTLYDQSYLRMFEGCSSLVNAPELPAWNLGNRCYEYMFCDCTSLTNLPVLSVTTLKYECYLGMFKGCTSLTTAPELPATILAEECYAYIFSGCTSLTTAPALPATTLAEGCYHQMFGGCTALTTAPSLPATTLGKLCYYQMFYGCTSLAVAPELPATALVESCYSNMFYHCTSLTAAPVLPAMTMVKDCYNGMFNGCASLTTAPALPSTDLGMECYAYMFKDCTSLTSAPALPATALTSYCYTQMFLNCTSLTNAPDLPAATLGDYSYSNMFSGCTSLNYIKCLATNISHTNCTRNWVKGVSATGTFTKAAGMSDWTTGDNGIPDGWTVLEE